MVNSGAPEGSILSVFSSTRLVVGLCLLIKTRTYPISENKIHQVITQLGLARLIEISVNRSIYKRKTIIDMKLKNRLLLMDVLSIYSIKIQA